jgi:Flp pilus assembly pilin Flp
MVAAGRNYAIIPVDSTKENLIQSWNGPNKEKPMSEMHTEEFHVNGEELIARIKELIHEGNIRRIIIKDKDGKTMIEFPLTFGVVGVVLAPTLAAVGAVAALIGEATIVVEKVDK